LNPQEVIITKIGFICNFRPKRFHKIDPRADNPKLRDFFPAHISRCLCYFRTADARIRSNAVVYLTSLLLESRATDDDVDGRSVCAAMSKMMADSSTDVQKTVAANLGKVVVKHSVQLKF
jgi:hypothetical protein